MKKSLIILFVPILLAVTGILFLGGQALASGPQPGENHLSDCMRDKISPNLWAVIEKQETQGIAFGGHRDQSAARGNLRYYDFVLGFERADYNHCLELPTKDEVRICMVEVFRTHADTVQAEARAHLDNLGIPYNIIYITTSMFIDAKYGSRDLVCELSKMEDVKAVYGNIIGPDTYSQIYAIDLTERTVTIRLCFLWDCYHIPFPVAENALINVPGIGGQSGFENLEVGQEIYYTWDDEYVITRIFVQQDLP